MRHIQFATRARDCRERNRQWCEATGSRDVFLEDDQEASLPGLMAFIEPLSTLDAAPPGWALALASALGVYLLTCPRDGSLYVGSASGEGGFGARWAEYRANGHGGM